jgi:hypothetical protein
MHTMRQKHLCNTERNQMKKLTAIAALVCGTAHAEFLTGNDLLAKFNGSDIQQMVGLGYVIGVFDATMGAAHCPPANVTSGQVQDVVKNHLIATPSTRHYVADVQVRYILGQTWPCKKKGTAL